MITNGKFTLINVISKEYNGKTYYNANIEDSEDGEVFEIAVNDDVVEGLNKKYQEYSGFFKIAEYTSKTGGKYLTRRLIAVETIVK